MLISTSTRVHVQYNRNSQIGMVDGNNLDGGSFVNLLYLNLLHHGLEVWDRAQLHPRSNTTCYGENSWKILG